MGSTHTVEYHAALERNEALTRHSMDEPLGNKPVAKGQILYDSIYMRY